MTHNQKFQDTISSESEKEVEGSLGRERSLEFEYESLAPIADIAIDKSEATPTDQDSSIIDMSENNEVCF